MKLYKVVLSIIDHDNIGKEAMLTELQNLRYANDCIAPQVESVEEHDIGEWSDDHPLNRRDTAEAEFKRLFSEAR